jgi:hypothetical protein
LKKRARIDHFNHLKALHEMEGAFSKRFRKLENRIWHELAPSTQTNRPCGLKAWSAVWDEMLELDNALGLVARLRKHLMAKGRSTSALATSRKSGGAAVPRACVEQKQSLAKQGHGGPATP